MQKRPYVICHMSPSIDGKIVSKNWPSLNIAYAAYERTATTLAADAWIVGRVSMAPYAGKSRVPRLTRSSGCREGFHRRGKARSYAIAIDPSGNSRGDRMPSMCTRDNGARRTRVRRLPGVSRIQGVSYIFGGSASIISGESWRNSGRRLGSAGCCSKAAARSMVIPRRRLDRRAEHPDLPRRGWQHRTPTLFDARREGVGAELRLISISRIRAIWSG